MRIRVRKHLALLAYLAVERRRAHDRDRLVELFWPRVPTSQGRHSCATALSELRRVFGKEALKNQRNIVRFDCGNLTLDLDLLDAGTIVGPDGEALYEVDGFLRGFDLDDSPEFTLWKEREHSRRLPTVQAGLLTLVDHGRRRGSHEEILRCAERLLSLDQFAEEGIRAKMEALALAGDRIAAVRVYDEWKGQLEADLRAVPSAALEGMALELRRNGWVWRTAQQPAPRDSDSPVERTFVGRKREYQRLYEAWESAKNFRPQLLVVDGDSGVGKTTLAYRLLETAELEGASVARVQCHSVEGRLPFAAICTLAVALAGRPGAAATSPSALAEIARYAPDVRLRFPGLPSHSESEGELARLRFADSLLELLIAVSEERPTLLVVDDAHFLDEASDAVLHYILRRYPAGRAMVVATSRSHSWAPTTRSVLDSNGGFERTTLFVEPMPWDDCIAVLSAVLGPSHHPSPPERNALIRAARGFPMALELLAEDWRVNGSASLALALSAITADLAIPPPGTPDVYERIIDRLLHELDHATRSVLALASVLGSRVAGLGTFRILDLTLGQAVAGISELTSRRILRDVGTGLEFVNELVRVHVYRRIPATLRTTLHASVADIGLSGGMAVPALELAWHLMRSGRRDEASEQLLQGAAEALTRGAPDEAVLALSGSLASVPATARPSVLRLLIEGQHELGRWLDVVKTTEALEEGERTPFIRALAIEARWRLGICGHGQLRQAVNDLLRLVDEEPERPGKALAVAAVIAGSLRDAALVAAVDRKAASATTTSMRHRALIRTAHAMAAYHCQEPEAAEAFANQAMQDLAEAGASDSAVAQLEIGIGVINSARGNYLPAFEHQMRARAVALRLGNEQLAFRAGCNACFAALRLGRHESVLELAKDIRITEAEVHNHSIRVNLINLIYSEAVALAIRGDAELAIARITREDLTEAIEADRAWHHQVWSLYRADVFWLAGHRSRARRLAQTVVAGDESRPMTYAVVGGFCRWATILWRVRLPRQQLNGAVRDGWNTRNRIDAVDRFEVVSAAIEASQWRSNIERQEMEAEARTLAGTLPAATVDFFGRFSSSRSGEFVDHGESSYRR